MNKEKGFSLQVKEFYQKAKSLMKLCPVSERIGFSKEAYIPPSREGEWPVQVWGKEKIQELQRLTPGRRREIAKDHVQEAVFCIVLADGILCPSELKEEAEKNRLALFFSRLSREECCRETRNFFSSLSSTRVSISAGLIQVFGLGVLIVGDSGIGKSESALELITRGHRFVSDDITQIERTEDRGLLGKASSISRNFMEVRGLGVINIKRIFGQKAIRSHVNIDLAIALKKWGKGMDYERIGLKYPEDFDILGEKIPIINIPVAPGRNIATLIEIACKVQLLRREGYIASEDISNRLDKAIHRQQKNRRNEH